MLTLVAAVNLARINPAMPAARLRHYEKKLSSTETCAGATLEEDFCKNLISILINFKLEHNFRA